MVRFLNQERFQMLSIPSAVEYRLLQHAPVPGALQDAAAVYTHLVTHRLGAFKGIDGKYHYPESPTPYHTDAHMHRVSVDTSFPGPSQERHPAIPSAQAGHRQHVENARRLVDGRNLVEPQVSGNDATASSLVDRVYSTQANTGPIAAAHRPRIILIGDSAGGNLVLALARWIRDEGVLPLPDGMILLSPSCDPCMHYLMTNRSFR
jgi:hypothetical protein